MLTVKNKSFIREKYTVIQSQLETLKQIIIDLLHWNRTNHSNNFSVAISNRT